MQQSKNVSIIKKYNKKTFPHKVVLKGKIIKSDKVYK
jgi:hypothetical protein